MVRRSALLYGLLLTGCGSDSVIAYPVGAPDSGQDDSGAEEGEDGGSSDGGSSDGGGSDGGAGEPAFAAGDLVISELMIDPTAVADESGEWVELYNASDRTLALDGLILGDDGVDAWVLDGGVRVAAGDWAVLCADTAASVNGGTSCDGAFDYNTWGDGFALANGGDEVVVRTAEGLVIDRMSYSDAQVQPGASLSLDPDKLSASANDSASAWCSQASPTPGRANRDC